MYGLERFGDYLMKMSNSTHRNKHVSICKASILHDLLAFLIVHDPSQYRSKQPSSWSQSHMQFNFSQVSRPSSWECTSRPQSRGVTLPFKALIDINQLYRSQYQVLGLNSDILANTLSNDAIQILGKLWCGVRYFQAYYEGYDETVLGMGLCCVSVPTLPDDDRSYDGQLFGILRCVVLHRAVMLTTCPEVYFFQVEILSVKPSSTDVPLLEANITGDCMWVSQASFDVFHANQNFCLRDHDDKDVASFYLIHLN
jgi:hypothetical protein